MRKSSSAAVPRRSFGAFVPPNTATRQRKEQVRGGMSETRREAFERPPPPAFPLPMAPLYFVEHLFDDGELCANNHARQQRKMSSTNIRLNAKRGRGRGGRGGERDQALQLVLFSLPESDELIVQIVEGGLGVVQEGDHCFAFFSCFSVSSEFFDYAMTTRPFCSSV